LIAGRGSRNKKYDDPQQRPSRSFDPPPLRSFRMSRIIGNLYLRRRPGSLLGRTLGTPGSIGPAARHYPAGADEAHFGIADRRAGPAPAPGSDHALSEWPIRAFDRVLRRPRIDADAPAIARSCVFAGAEGLSRPVFRDEDNAPCGSRQNFCACEAGGDG